MSARKLREWQMYAELEPFGQPAAFWRAGLITAQLRNVNRAKKSDAIANPEDFMPQTFKPEPESAEPTDVGAQIVQVFQGLAELNERKGSPAR